MTQRPHGRKRGWALYRICPEMRDSTWCCFLDGHACPVNRPGNSARTIAGQARRNVAKQQAQARDANPNHPLLLLCDRNNVPRSAPTAIRHDARFVQPLSKDSREIPHFFGNLPRLREKAPQATVDIRQLVVVLCFNVLVAGFDEAFGL